MINKWLKPIHYKKIDYCLVIIKTLAINKMYKCQKICISGYFGYQYLTFRLHTKYYLLTKKLIQFQYPTKRLFNNKFFRRIGKSIGLYYKLFNNFFYDISFLKQRKMRLNGVGFRVFKRNRLLILSIGFSYLVKIKIPTGVEIKVTDEKKQCFLLWSFSRQLLNNTVFAIRKIHPPDTYCGQGIIFAEEHKKLKLKPGKRQSQTY